MCDVPIDDRAQCHVRRLTMYKKRSNSEHEFIVAELTNAAYLLVERLVPKNTPSIKVASTLSDSSSSISKSIPAEDRVSIYPKKDAKFTNALSTVKLVHDYTFAQFPVLEFARIIAAVSDYSGIYALASTMCYWYASIITALSAQLFQGTSSEEPTIRGGTWRLVIKFPFDEEAFEIIKENYIQERNGNPQPTGPTLAMIIEERRLRQASDERAEQSKEQEERTLAMIIEEQRLRQASDERAEQSKEQEERTLAMIIEERRLRQASDERAEQSKAHAERLQRELDQTRLELERNKATAGSR